MTRRIGAGVLELFVGITVAAPAAPTVAELNAFTDLTGALADGGLSTPFDGNIVDAADMGTAFNKTAPGTFGGQPLNMELFRDFPADAEWLLLVRGFVGYAAISRGGLATPGVWAAGDDVELWPMAIVSRNRIDVARNEMQRFTSMSAVTDEPTEDFALA